MLMSSINWGNKSCVLSKPDLGSEKRKVLQIALKYSLCGESMFVAVKGVRIKKAEVSPFCYAPMT